MGATIILLLSMVILSLAITLKKRNSELEKIKKDFSKLEDSNNLIIKLSQKEFEHISLESIILLNPDIINKMQKEISDYYFWIFYLKNNDIKMKELGNYILHSGYIDSDFYVSEKWPVKKALARAIAKMPNSSLFIAIFSADDLLAKGETQEVTIEDVDKGDLTINNPKDGEIIIARNFILNHTS